MDAFTHRKTKSKPTAKDLAHLIEWHLKYTLSKQVCEASKEHLFTALALPPLVEGLLKGENPDGDDDLADWIKYLLLNPLFYWLSTIPIARDAASIMEFGRVPGSVYANFFNTFFQPAKKVYKMADGKDVKASSFVKDLMNALAMGTGVPVGGQVADWVSWSTGVMTGDIEAESPADILYGIYRGKERK